MIETCWNEQRELRLDIRAVCLQLSALSTQEDAEGERGNRPAHLSAARIEQLVPFLEDSLIQPSSNADEDPPPPRPPLKSQRRDSLFVEGNSYNFQQLGHAHHRTIFRFYQENTFQASRTSKTIQTPPPNQNLRRS